MNPTRKLESSSLLRLTLGACLLILTYFLLPLLTGQSILAHDNYYWNFPIFHYTAVTLMKGSLPLWDPFSTGGQPFYPHLVQFRLLEPLVLLTIGVGQFFTQNTVILFNVSKILQTLCMCRGAYLCLERYSSTLLTRALLIPTLLFSSFFLGSFHQDGILSQFVWIPWVMHFLISIFLEGDRRWYRFLFLAVFVGLSWQSYQFVGTCTVLTVFFVGLFFFHRSSFSVFREEKFKVLTLVSLILLMMGPNLVLIQEGDRFVFPLRMAPKDFKERLLHETGLPPAEFGPGDVKIGIRMPYEMVPYTGAMVKVWELIQAFSPNSNPNIHTFTNPDTWGTPSEAYIFIGLFGWAMSLLGFTLSKAPHRKLWLTFTAVFGLLMMGPPGGLHRILFFIFPPLWFIRHTTLFVLFFLFGCLYFFVQGIETALNKKENLKVKATQWATLLPFSIVLFTFGVLATKLDYPVFKFPQTNFLFVVFLVLGLAARQIFPLIGGQGLWYSLVTAQAALVLFLSFDKSLSLIHLVFFLALPLLVLAWYRQTKKGATVLLLSIFLLSFTDLLYGFWSAGQLYKGQATPEKTFGFPMAPKAVTLQPKEVYPDYPRSLYGRQAPRYLSLLEQKPYAFSGVLHFKGSEDQVFPRTTEFALRSLRWNSYLLQKNYFDLVYSKFSPLVISKLLRIGESPLAFFSKSFPESVFLELVAEGKADKILEKGVIVSDKVRTIAASENNASNIETLDYSYNHWVGRVETNTPGFLFFADGYDRYWEAKINGTRSQITRLNLSSKGVFLDTGKHQVEFHYRPKPFLIATFLFLLIPFVVFLAQATYQMVSWIRNTQKSLVPQWS